jgi:hypothetical protein
MNLADNHSSIVQPQRIQTWQYRHKNHNEAGQWASCVRSAPCFFGPATESAHTPLADTRRFGCSSNETDSLAERDTEDSLPRGRHRLNFLDALDKHTTLDIRYLLAIVEGVERKFRLGLLGERINTNHFLSPLRLDHRHG